MSVSSGASGASGIRDLGERVRRVRENLEKAEKLRERGQQRVVIRGGVASPDTRRVITGGTPVSTPPVSQEGMPDSSFVDESDTSESEGQTPERPRSVSRGKGTPDPMAHISLGRRRESRRQTLAEREREAEAQKETVAVAERDIEVPVSMLGPGLRSSGRRRERERKLRSASSSPFTDVYTDEYAVPSYPSESASGSVSVGTPKGKAEAVPPIPAMGERDNVVRSVVPRSPFGLRQDGLAVERISIGITEEGEGEGEVLEESDEEDVYSESEGEREKEQLRQGSLAYKLAKASPVGALLVLFWAILAVFAVVDKASFVGSVLYLIVGSYMLRPTLYLVYYAVLVLLWVLSTSVTFFGVVYGAILLTPNKGDLYQGQEWEDEVDAEGEREGDVVTEEAEAYRPSFLRRLIYLNKEERSAWLECLREIVTCPTARLAEYVDEAEQEEEVQPHVAADESQDVYGEWEGVSLDTPPEAEAGWVRWGVRLLAFLLTSVLGFLSAVLGISNRVFISKALRTVASTPAALLHGVTRLVRSSGPQGAKPHAGEEGDLGECEPSEASSPHESVEDIPLLKLALGALWAVCVRGVEGVYTRLMKSPVVRVITRLTVSVSLFSAVYAVVTVPRVRGWIYMALRAGWTGGKVIGYLTIGWCVFCIVRWHIQQWVGADTDADKQE
ncbi:hypothetical protein KIPB_005153 [Kipferlia bialata]|uniref:Uncharacterized protein n=1 Tax=Kipferlia bialata TaxID=797122 RepID=A0A9K3CWM3_9EUKA|nr:hypothetical protein KIPB_005153 [Kipferlia bialata]|eukprot:g5153.t1